MGVKGALFACFIIGIIGTAIGIHQTTKTLTTLGAASYLAILAIVLNLSGAILTIRMS